MKEPLYLLDSYSLIYRSYFAFIRRPLRNAEGRNTSAVFGFFRSLFSLFAERRPEYFAAVFDSRIPTFRHIRYEAYKGTREKTPDDLRSQIPIVEELLTALGVPILRADGFEADDVIATYASRCCEDDHPCRIISGDKDLLQLVDGSVLMLRPDQGGYREIGAGEVVTEWGVNPDQITDYLALTGDQSDNVPGVPGIGDKSAAKLLADFGSLDAIYERLSEVTPESRRKKLEEGRDSAYLSRELVILRKDVPLETTLEALKFPLLDAGSAVPIFLREGLKSLADDLENGKVAPVRGLQTGAGTDRRGQGAGNEGVRTENTAAGAETYPGAGDSLFFDGDEVDAGPAVEPVEVPAPAIQHTPLQSMKGSYETILKVEDFDRWIEAAREKGVFAFDMETDSIDPMAADPMGFSMAVKSGEGCYVPIRASGETCIPEPVLKERLAAILGNPSCLVVGQNLKYDYKVLARWGVRFRAVPFDTMVAAWLLESDQMTYNLARISGQYLGYDKTKYEEIVPKGATFDSLPLDIATAYAAEDADVSFRLYEVFAPMLEHRGLLELFRNVEMPLLVLLADMERTGIRLDGAVLAAFDSELDNALAALEEEIYRLCGKQFNINSTKQLQEVLFVDRKLQTSKKTKTGYSTDVSVLEELAREDPVPERVLRHRMLSKLKSTYVTALPKLVNPETGRVHTNFVQTGTATGRLSSRDPNLQNIPIREEEGRRIRSAFIPDPGMIFVSADYSQIELVILAHLSGDPGLTEAFTSGSDVHRQTAAILFGVVPGNVTPEQRRIAKTINFGVMYGMSAFRLSRELGIPRASADRFINAYFTKYARIQDFMAATVREAERTGMVKTLFGRERKIPAIRSRNKTEKMGAERIAINTPIQGTAADIMKMAMLRVSRRLTEVCPTARMLLQVHDELILEVPEKDMECVCTLLREEMEKTVELSLPLRVNVESGVSWGVLH